MIRKASTLLLATLLGLGCGSSEPEGPTAEEKQAALLFRSMTTLEAVPDRIRQEVLKTCDKWKRLDRPCVDKEVRVDQLECWLEEGMPWLKIYMARRIGPRSRDLQTLVKQRLCMEKRRWKRIKSGPEI